MKSFNLQESLMLYLPEIELSKKIIEQKIPKYISYRDSLFFYKNSLFEIDTKEKYFLYVWNRSWYELGNFYEIQKIAKEIERAEKVLENKKLYG